MKGARLYAPNKIGGYRYVVLYVKIDKYVGEIMVHLTETIKALCRATRTSDSRAPHEHQ